MVRGGQGVGGVLERENFLFGKRGGDGVGNYEEFITNYMPPGW